MGPKVDGSWTIWGTGASICGSVGVGEWFFVIRHFFDFRLYSEVADKGGSWIAAYSLPFRVGSVLGSLGCFWCNILSGLSEILEGRWRQHSLQNEPYLSTKQCGIIPGNYQKFKNDIYIALTRLKVPIASLLLRHHICSCRCSANLVRGIHMVALRVMATILNLLRYLTNIWQLQ